WTSFRPKQNQIDGQASRYADHTNTGILTGDVVAIDIDAPDVAIAEQLVDRLMDIPGAADAPRRTGKAPKCLFIFRAAEPRSKRETPEYLIAGEKFQVEVLGTGNQ